MAYPVSTLRVGCDSPSIHVRLLGALPAIGGARNIRQAYRQLATADRYRLVSLFP